MAFIRKTKSREGRHFLYLVEGYRVEGKVKQRIIKKLGILEEMEEKEPGVYERLKQEAKEGKLHDADTEKIILELDLKSSIQSPPVNYGWKILEGIYYSLGLNELIGGYATTRKFKFNLNKILKLLVFQRILTPKSKRATVQSQEKLFGQWDIAEKDLYRGLDNLYELKSAIQLTLHDKVSQTTGRTGTLVFYDVTNYYFETDLDDTEIVDTDGNTIKRALRRRGPSKERRPNPIVQLGLFMDSDGIPISYQLFEGNKVDPTTYIPAIEQVKKQFGIERMVTVADKAMNSKKNTSDAFNQGDGWLFSQKFRGKRGSPKEIQQFVLDPTGWRYNKEMTFAMKSYIRERKCENKIIVKEKVLATWNKSYDTREKIRRNGAVEYAEKLTNAERFQMTARKGGKRYLEIFTVDKETGEKLPFSPFIDIDKERIEYDEQFDGINVLVTSETGMPDEEMITQYRELSKIEDCFRVTKTELEARPVYVRTETHIEAHFLTCFISLVFMRLIQHKIDWKMSPQKIVDALNSGKCREIKSGIWEVWADESLIKLNRMLGMDFEKQYVKIEALNRYGRSWFTT